MSSGFVSGSTANAPVERSDEWLAAQQEIEATRRRKVEESRQNSGRSLYETLEANKAAKQEAFEESIKLKNQFRALDADEVEFLDAVLESTRAAEERVRKETAEGLEAFRRRQEEAVRQALARAASAPDGAGLMGDEGAEEGEWAAPATAGGRKRKRRDAHEPLLKGVKIRRPSTAGEKGKGDGKTAGLGSTEKVGPGNKREDVPSNGKEISSAAPPTSKPSAASPPAVTTKPAAASPAKPALGLVDYGSDSDE